MHVANDTAHEIRTSLREKKQALLGALVLFWRYAKYLRKHRLRIVAITGMILFVSMFGMVTPLLGKVLVDRVLPTHDWSLFWTITLGYAIASFLMQSVASFQGYLALCMMEEVRASLSTTYIRNFLHLPYRDIQEKQAGAQIFRATSDISAVTSLLTGFFTGLAKNIVSLVTAVAIMLTLNWKVTVIFVVFVPIVLLLRLYITLKIRPLHQELRDHNEELSAFLGGIFAGTKTVKLFGTETRESLRYLRLLRENIRLNFRIWRMNFIYGKIQGMFEAGVPSLLQWWIWILVMKEHTTLGSAVAISWYFTMIITPFMNLVASVQSIIMGMVPGERIAEALSCRRERLHDMPALPERRDGCTIRFRNVGFSYDGIHDILKHVSLELRSGTITALVGPSGSGKTTLINLICALYPVSTGRIEINGRALDQVSVASLRGNIALVPQDAFLFKATIADNIRYAKREATRGEIVRAARLACIHDKIVSLPDAYDTVLKRGENELSAGEKQRLALARAFLRDSPIFIFDEAFANLDVATESRIINHLLARKDHKLIVIVAHRLKTTDFIDRTIAVRDGTIVELPPSDAIFNANSDDNAQGEQPLSAGDRLRRGCLRRPNDAPGKGDGVMFASESTEE